MALRSGRFPIRSKARLSTDADLAFFAYFQSVPQQLRRLVGPLGVYQWLTLDFIRHDADFAAFVDGLQANRQSNLLHLCFSLSRAVDQGRAARRACAAIVKAEKRVKLLNHLTATSRFCFNDPWDERRLRLLYKLNAPLITFDEIERFLRLTSLREIQDYAAHAKRLSLEGLELFDALVRIRPVKARLPNVLDAFSSIDDARGLLELVKDAARELKPKSLARIFDFLRRISTEDDVFSWMVDVIDELDFNTYGSRRFPDPPLLPDEFIAPLDSFDALVREARHMRNCLSTKAKEVVEGQTYFYHWRGPEEATLELTQHDNGHWGLTEALGRRNRALSYQTREAIENHVIRKLESRTPSLNFGAVKKSDSRCGFAGEINDTIERKERERHAEKQVSFHAQTA